MKIKNAKYMKSALNPEQEINIIKVTINDVESFVPLDPENSDYAEIMRQVEAGELTIKEADKK
tara:strand:+ start:48 stop:236 length:189 start_codon:yes stop_codon:yes gene_type:complete